DVRRYPRGHLSASPTADGWLFRGTVSWVSGWGLNQVLLLAAVEEPTSRVVTALVPVSARTIATPLMLRAVAGSRTVRVRIDGVAVPTADVLTVEPLATWGATDRAETSDARPHVFGLTARVLDELRAEAAATDVVARWAPRVAEIRSRAYTLADDAKAAEQPDHAVDQRLAVKATAAENLATLSQALLVARAGRGIAADDTAQLHARSALFFLVQGQTAGVREVQLTRIAAQVPAGGAG
ncbi:MAG: acyl-CoA dehydrogenase, partial [Mycobacterium sp.]